MPRLKQTLTDHTTAGGVTFAGGLAILTTAGLYTWAQSRGVQLYPGIETALTVIYSHVIAAGRRRRASRC